MRNCVLHIYIKKIILVTGVNYEVEVSRSHTVSDEMYVDMKIIFVRLLNKMFS